MEEVKTEKKPDRVVFVGVPAVELKPPKYPLVDSVVSEMERIYKRVIDAIPPAEYVQHTERAERYRANLKGMDDLFSALGYKMLVTFDRATYKSEVRLLTSQYHALTLRSFKRAEILQHKAVSDRIMLYSAEYFDRKEANALAYWQSGIGNMACSMRLVALDESGKEQWAWPIQEPTDERPLEIAYKIGVNPNPHYPWITRQMKAEQEAAVFELMSWLPFECSDFRSRENDTNEEFSLNKVCNDNEYWVTFRIGKSKEEGKPPMPPIVGLEQLSQALAESAALRDLTEA